jgi:hypothetical protein
VVSTVSNIGQAVADTENLVTVGVSLDEDDQIDIAVGGEGSPSSRSDEYDSDEVAAPSAFDVP